MKSTNIPYEQRILGQYYYCSNRTYEHIFQVDELDGSDFPHIRRAFNKDWDEKVNTYCSFKRDWIAGSDIIMRLATAEEIQFLKSLDEDKLLIQTTPQYEIF